MRRFFKNLIDFHSLGSTISFGICVAIVVGGVLGGIIHHRNLILKYDDVQETNYFINEPVPLHNNNYDIYVRDAYMTSSISITDKKGNSEVLESNFIAIDLTVQQSETSSFKKHNFDFNDFKLKDHTGVYFDFNEIMDCVGWSGIDFHFDPDSNHIISSSKYTTSKCVSDYSLRNLSISPSQTISFTIYFKQQNDVIVLKNLLILEVDFYPGILSRKKGIDIILLPNPFNATNISQLYLQ